MLFGIRGVQQNEHDDRIPSVYFDTPPVALDSASEGTEALHVMITPLLCPYSELMSPSFNTLP